MLRPALRRRRKAETPSTPPDATGPAHLRPGSPWRLPSWAVPPLVALVWAGGAAVFFRAQLSSGFGRVTGDDGDTRLIVYLCEHWFQLFHGHGAWRELTFFYPVKGLLGWSDTFFLYEIFYTPLRLLGCEPFLAFQLTLVALSAVGFASFVYLVRRAFGAPLPVALLGAATFTFSSTLWQHVNSPQLLDVYLVPLVLLLAVAAFRAVPVHPRRALLLGVSTGLLWALMLYTTYYVGWFLGLSLAVVVVVGVVTRPRRFVVGLLGGLRRARWAVVAAVVGFAAGLVPFALTYLPVLHQTGGLRYAQVMSYSPAWGDLLNLGPGNLLWSGVVDRLASAGAAAPYEVTFGITPVLLGAALALSLVAVVHRRSRGPLGRTAAVLVAAAAVLIVLPVHASWGSPWAVIWHVPGATAVRAIDRLQVLTGLVVVLALTAALTDLGDRLRSARRWRAGTLRLLGLALLAVVVAEQFNTTDKSLIDRSAQVALVASVRPPPANCRSFFVVDSRADFSSEPYVEQIDAMLVSQKIGMPTLNGYTAHNPTDWHLEFTGIAAYPLHVEEWAVAHHVRVGLCRLDLGTMAWKAYPRLPRLRRS